MSAPEGLREEVAALRTEWGLDARELDRVLTALTTGGTLGELVRASTVPRRDVKDVLLRLAPWLRADGERSTLAAVVAAPSTPDGVADPLAATMARIAAGLPPSLWDLDHVPATPETMAARARFLTGEYELAGATLLCVGDHDLTSVAVALVEPGVEILAVDVDQRLLEYLGEVARDRALPITPVFADLRLGLPASLAGRADLAFTDPPYTPEGVGLFVARALEGLRRSGHERVALAYGFSPHQLTRGFRTQSALHELRLVLEAVLPRFSRFDGAEAVGAAASLYVCRPTRWTWPVLERAGRGDPRIYTRGAAAAESAPPGPDEATLAALDAVAPPAADRLLIGDGWPVAAPGRRVPLEDFLADPATARTVPALVCLAPHLGAALPAVLLAAAGRAVVAVAVPARDAHADLDGPLRTLLGPVLELTARHRAGAPSVVLARSRRTEPDPVADVLGWLGTHPAAALGNSWREALLRVADRPLTKNEARTLVRDAGLPAGTLGLRLVELPRASLAAVVAAVPGTVRAARESS